MLSLLLEVPVHCFVLTCSMRAVFVFSVFVKETEASEMSWVPSMQIQAWSQSQFPKICLLCQCHWNGCETFRQGSLMRNICDCGPGESCLTIGIGSVASVN